MHYVDAPDACGMDFGTSNSTVGWVADGKPVLLTLENNKNTLPSVIFYNTEEDTVAFGRAALEQYLAGYEGRMMRSLKSLLGSALIDEQTEIGGRAVSFRTILTRFIAELKQRAETAAGRSFSRVVIGRPVYYVDDNPVADKLAEQTMAEIAQACGFTSISFQYEPIAAAFDYESGIASDELVLIVDVGGGTTDFSLVRLSPDRRMDADRRQDIIDNDGVHIGGTDFDKYLNLSQAMPLLGLGSQLNNGIEVPSGYYFNLATWHTIYQVYTKKVMSQLQELRLVAKEPQKMARLIHLVNERAGHWLAIQVEECKIALSSSQQARLDMSRIEKELAVEISRAAFDDAVAHLVGQIETTLSRMFVKAGVQAADIDTVFFTGGSSGILSLRQRLAALLPDAKKVEGDLFGSIGMGLALDAAKIYGS